MKKRATALVLGIVAVIIVSIVVLLLASHKSQSPSGGANEAVTKQQITANWKTFFAAPTPLKDREQLLQNGSQFDPIIQSLFKAFGPKDSAAVVNSVKLNNATSASVNYTVELSGQPVLSNQTGKAVFVDHSWKVSASTFCQLLSMAGNKPSACQNVK